MTKTTLTVNNESASERKGDPSSVQDLSSVEDEDLRRPKSVGCALVQSSRVRAKGAVCRVSMCSQIGDSVEHVGCRLHRICSVAVAVSGLQLSSSSSCGKRSDGSFEFQPDDRVCFGVRPLRASFQFALRHRGAMGVCCLYEPHPSEVSCWRRGLKTGSRGDVHQLSGFVTRVSAVYVRQLPSADVSVRLLACSVRCSSA